MVGSSKLQLFDAFFSGCIPIYVGTNLQEFSIPSNLYIQAKPNLKSIQECVSKLYEKDYVLWNTELVTWINSQNVKKFWSADEVNMRVISKIREYCEITVPSI